MQLTRLTWHVVGQLHVRSQEMHFLGRWERL